MSKQRVISICVTVLVVAGLVHYTTNHPASLNGIRGHTIPATDGPTALVRALRPIYPYSVIQGGAYTPRELQSAWRGDTTVQAHYSDFNFAHTQMVTLTAERYEYVSYRLRNQIYWTKKKLRIPRGELLLTDGVNYARARCGNRLSDMPHEASISRNEPSNAVLTMPTVSEKTLPQMAFASPNQEYPQQQNSVSSSVENHSHAVSGAEPGGALEFPPAALFPLETTAFPALVPVSPGLPALSSKGSAPPVAVNGPQPATVSPPPSTPPVSALPPMVGTQSPPPVPTPVPEPTTVYLFLVTLLISLFALIRMSPKSKRN